MDTLTVSIPVPPLHTGMPVADYLREAPSLVSPWYRLAARCLGEAAEAVRRGHDSVTLTVTSGDLGTLADACRQLIGQAQTYPPAAPVLRAIADACEAALGEAA